MNRTDIIIDLQDVIDILECLRDQTKNRIVKIALEVCINYLVDQYYNMEEKNVQFPENNECDLRGSDLPF